MLRIYISVACLLSMQNRRALMDMGIQSGKTHLCNAMVTYRLPYGDLNSPNCTAALRFLCKPYGDLTVFSSQQSHHKPWHFLNLAWHFFINRNAATTPQVHRRVTVRWLCDDCEVAYVFLPCLECLENRRAASRLPCGGHTAPLRWPYD